MKLGRPNTVTDDERKLKKSIYMKQYSQRPEVKELKKVQQKENDKNNISLKNLRKTAKYQGYRKKWEQSEAGKMSRKIARQKRREKELYDNYSKDDLLYTQQLFNYKCFNCPETENLELDHHNPLSRGNSLNRSNAVILCKSCNSSKKDKSPVDFYTIEQINLLEEQYLIITNEKGKINE